MRIRTGGPESAAVLLSLLDGAVDWLAARGRTDQWGPVPWSRRPGAVERAERVTAEHLVRIAWPGGGGGAGGNGEDGNGEDGNGEDGNGAGGSGAGGSGAGGSGAGGSGAGGSGGGGPLGICVLADRAPAGLPAAGEPELFVRWLVTGPAHRGAGVGAALIADARRLARERGADLLRVDCYAGGDGGLVARYERLGFTRTTAFTEDRPTGPWPGQLLELRVHPGRRADPLTD
ncbi:GNAT family N-acetyltransferase [Kitasatospora sp. SolWspMP-SS2h]|uniref:GNAT family N-acetyltransferase n=1 Tax=Kitasatospora sp. SolWspMP-SS2h TaxID=1305729 RepID=UPI000DB97A34|nr:GNAT family N-acetyltransferase [Kitasatospora sp. SolWspMP-SS2h]